MIVHHPSLKIRFGNMSDAQVDRISVLMTQSWEMIGCQDTPQNVLMTHSWEMIGCRHTPQNTTSGSDNDDHGLLRVLNQLLLFLCW